MSRLRLHKEYMNILSQEIVTGVRPPGTLLPSEVELVEQFGISRGVVRESLRGLEERGLVAVLHGKGAIVLPAEEWDLFDGDLLAILVDNGHEAGVLSEFLHCRKILEVDAAGLAAARATRTQLADLRAAYELLVERVRNDEAGDQRSEDKYHSADASFHRVLAAASGNRALARLVHEMHRTLLPRQILARPRGRRSVILAEHERILLAVEARDEAEARQAMADHLGNVERYLAAFEESKNRTERLRRNPSSPVTAKPSRRPTRQTTSSGH